MFALAWQDDVVGSELLLVTKALHDARLLLGSRRIHLDWLRYRSVRTSLPDQVSPNARH